METAGDASVPTRIVLIPDIHANLPALEAVLDDIDRRDVHAIHHLGDLVGYAPWPDETVALLNARGITGVSGNYDSTVATDHPHCGCRYEDPQQEAMSHASYEWTRAHISAGTKRALGALPFRIDLRPAGGHAPGPRIVLVHGTPTLNTLYWTENRPDSFCLEMARFAGLRAGDVLAFGHTHRPWQRMVEGILFVNAGSAGRPKDGDPRACWALLHASEAGVRAEFVRVPYDIERACSAILESGLPPGLADFLRTGGGPVST